jgi:RNA polymerase sigma-70 factor (ECF subfamily)
MNPTAPRTDLEGQLAEVWFRSLYAEHGRDLLAYALRRTPNPEDAADILAETFLVAWRRSSEVPPGPQARLWLFGVARRVLANQRRADRRRTRLAERLRSEVAEEAANWPHAQSEDGAVLAALARLTPEDRELLTLIAWEELTPAQAARVLGASSVAVRSRLLRARRRLRRELDGDGPPIQAERERDEVDR